LLSPSKPPEENESSGTKYDQCTPLAGIETYPPEKVDVVGRPMLTALHISGIP